MPDETPPSAAYHYSISGDSTLIYNSINQLVFVLEHYDASVDGITWY